MRSHPKLLKTVLPIRSRSFGNLSGGRRKRLAKDTTSYLLRDDKEWEQRIEEELRKRT